MKYILLFIALFGFGYAAMADDLVNDTDLSCIYCILVDVSRSKIANSVTKICLKVEDPKSVQKLREKWPADLGRISIENAGEDCRAGSPSDGDVGKRVFVTIYIRKSDSERREYTAWVYVAKQSGQGWAYALKRVRDRWEIEKIEEGLSV